MYGAERGILAVARYIDPGHAEVHIGVIKDSPELEAPLCRQAAQLGLRTCIFESYGRLSLSSIAQIRAFIRKNAIDVLHTHGYKTDLIGLIASLGTGCKAVATPHGWGASPGPKVRLYEAMDRLAFVFFDAVTPLSRELYAGLRRVPGLRGRLHLIPNGVDLSDLQCEGSIPQPLRGWRQSGTTVIGYVGRLDAGKRLDTLIYAFHSLQLARKRLCIVGDGPERERLVRLATALGESAHVEFFGFREDRVALMRGFDLFVLPSAHEGLPRCLMEAMGLGIAVVASNIPGCRDLVCDDSVGLLFAPGDVASLTGLMKRLADDPSLRAQLGANARDRIRKEWSAEMMAQRHLALYEQLKEFSDPRFLAENRG